MNQSYWFRDRQYNGNETLHNVRFVVVDVRLTQAQLAVMIGPKHIYVFAFFEIASKHHGVRMTQCYLADMLGIHYISIICFGFKNYSCIQYWRKTTLLLVCRRSRRLRGPVDRISPICILIRGREVRNNLGNIFTQLTPKCIKLRLPRQHCGIDQLRSL